MALVVQHGTGSLVNLFYVSQLRTSLTPRIKMQDFTWQFQGGDKSFF